MTPSYIDQLPPRTEGVIAAACHAIDIDDPITRSAVSSLEAPSAIASVLQLFPAWRPIFGEIPTPDPRLPYSADGAAMWRYDPDTDFPTPAVPEPDRRTSELITDIANSDYNMDAWVDRASKVAGQFGPGGAAELFSIMIHVPPTPQKFWPWDWRFRVQVASALLVSRLDATNSPDAGGDLERLLRGQIDWTTSAAMFGLVARARNDPGAASVCLALIVEAIRRPMCPIWFMCGYEPAFRLLRDFPGVPAKLKETVRKVNEQLDAEDD